MRTLLPIFSVLLLVLTVSCEDDDSPESPYTERELTYELEINPCDAVTPCAFVEGGATGYVEVKELKAGGIEIGVYMDGLLDGAQHPVHLHEGELIDGGNMVAMLSFMQDVGDNKAESITQLQTLNSDGSEMTFDRFASYDGVIKVHLDDNAYSKVVIAYANIGSNAIQ